MIQDGSLVMAFEVEIGVIGQIDNGILIRGSSVVKAQLALVAEGILYPNRRVPG